MHPDSEVDVRIRKRALANDVADSVKSLRVGRHEPFDWTRLERSSFRRERCRSKRIRGDGHVFDTKNLRREVCTSGPLGVLTRVRCLGS